MKKRIKPYLLIVLVCMAAGLCFVGRTWAWPTVSLVSKDHLSVGAVAGTVKLWLDDEEVSVSAPVLPGEYEAELVSSGDAEGWFVLRLNATESDTEPKVCRTEVMAPRESIRFYLHLAETAVLTVEGRWDPVDENMDVFLEDDMVFWGQSEAEEETEDPETEEPTEEPTEATESDPTEEPAEEPTEAPTDALETEETEEPTEAPEPETTEPESGEAAA